MIYVNNLSSMIKDLKPISIVDFGCGYGNTLYFIPCKYKVGIDIKRENIEALTKNTSAIGIVGDITKHYFNERFESAICNNVIEHTLDDKAVISNIYKSLEPKGVLYISSIIRKSWAIKYLYKFKGKPYNNSMELVNLLTSQGFKILQQKVSVYKLRIWSLPFMKGKLWLPIPGFQQIEVLCQK